MGSMTDHRRLVVDRIRKELLGPVGGEHELVVGRPSFRYITGMLFPQELDCDPSELRAVEQEIEDATGSEDPDEAPDATVAAAYDLLPSSMGISFYVEGSDELKVEAWAARYKRCSLKTLLEEFVATGARDSACATALDPFDLDARTVRAALGGVGDDVHDTVASALDLPFISCGGVSLNEHELIAKLRNFLESGLKDKSLANELRQVRIDPNTVSRIVSSGQLAVDAARSLEEHLGPWREPEVNGAVQWRRAPLPPEQVRIPIPTSGTTAVKEYPCLEGAAHISARFRSFGSGHLVTVTLRNAAEPQASMKADETVERMLFQAGFEVRTSPGAIGAYPDTRRLSLHPEDEELALTYSDRRTFGIGHGCAAIWREGTTCDGVEEIRAEVLPEHVVRGLTNDVALNDPVAERALDLAWLSDEGRTTEELSEALDAFLAAYAGWVEQQGREAERIGLTPPVERLLERQREAIERMRRGVETVVKGSPESFRAFQLAQRAMSIQFAWSARRRGGPFDLGKGSVDPIQDAELTARWYPFQLGFQLLVLESLENHQSADRDLVDLLWFPTGGGKTEAYLALAAFEMVHRRLRYQDPGPAVLMRYTLRLLTAQQFERSATLVGALETIRRRVPELGEAPFRLGLWVGGGLTPNRLTSDDANSPGALELVEELMEAEEPDNPFQLRQCPRCATRLVPRRKSPEEAYGVRADASSFCLNCPDERCELHEEIPASVVDEDLFRRPPTFLVGTIDKFARMVWDARSRSLLGLGGGLPVSLIIQDELHLITGPLGSIAGGYEAAIETVLACSGVSPKYLASTATIQRANEQCRSLYARSPFVFPPSGLRVDDSFFSREDRYAPGRLYFGIMGNGLYSSLTTLVQTSAAAAQAVLDVPAAEVRARDSYWTQVIYHNSKQELGKTTTMLRDDVRTRLELLEKHEEDRRVFENVEELSANLKGSMVAEAIERLEVEWQPGHPKEVIDAVACTNMISVGVDIGRLGIMLVKGQPKSTAEYIQATSRVGRDRNRPPGIVLTMFGQTRPRDRSHYETFQSYHQALYRYVEPSSVTPFSPRARDRTLHAALVLALRQKLEWVDEDRAGDLDPSETQQREIVEFLKERIGRACRPDDRTVVQAELAHRIDEWLELAAANRVPGLRFKGGAQFHALLRQFDDRSNRGKWATLNSMRHVDGETPFVVLGQGVTNNGE
jgi:hypothetical protein